MARYRNAGLDARCLGIRTNARQTTGFRVSCPEEIAFRMGLISGDDLEQLGRELGKAEYRRYLLAIAAEGLGS